MIRPPRKLGRGDHLTATHYNALLEFVRRIMPLKGSGTSVDYTMGGARINAGAKKASEPRQTKPWTVQWNSDANALEVYVPAEAVQLQGATVHLASASRTGWYLVHGASNPAAGSTLVVTAHVKGRAKEGSSGEIHPVVTVTAASEGTVDYASKAGDIWAMDIAKCETSTPATQGDTPERTVNQLFTGSVNPHQPVAGMLELYWETGATSAAGMAFVPHVEAAYNAPLCGRPLADTALGTGASVDVYYIVDCSGQTPSASISSTEVAASTHVCVRIYHLANGMVENDLRAALAYQVYYP